MRLPRTVRGAAAAAGPLLFVEGAPAAALGEWVRLRAPGAPERRGQVIEAAAGTTVVQVLEETLGLAPASVEVTFTGREVEAVVGRELLGRTLDGAGRPLDGLPAPVGEGLRPLQGAPLNPYRRLPPRHFIETGVSAIDGLNTLVRGQKLPIFSAAGLPGMELAARIVEGARAPGDEPFAVLFVAIGITARTLAVFLDRFGASGAAARSVLYLNQARDPTIERLMAPRLALAQAEFLAFEAGYHVLVVLADMTHYCEALREISTAREEIPGRRGYPGYLYTDLATLFERAGIVEGGSGSITQIPLLSMPDDDITHPIPDLTGYITEGQLVLSRELHRLGVDPPIDVLPSLSRLQGSGIGEGRTVAGHRQWADQLYASYARGRDARLMSRVVGEAGLTDADRRALAFADRFERELVGQGASRRGLGQTLEIGWRLLESLPRTDLGRLTAADWERRGAAAGASR